MKIESVSAGMVVSDGEKFFIVIKMLGGDYVFVKRLGFGGYRHTLHVRWVRPAPTWHLDGLKQSVFPRGSDGYRIQLAESIANMALYGGQMAFLERPHRVIDTCLCLWEEARQMGLCE